MLRARLVGEAPNEVDYRLTIDEHTDRRTHFAAFGKVVGERLTHGTKALVAQSTDRRVHRPIMSPHPPPPSPRNPVPIPLPIRSPSR